MWHETYEYRQSPVIAYYDCRNSLIVNPMYDGENMVQKRRGQVLGAIKKAYIYAA